MNDFIHVDSVTVRDLLLGNVYATRIALSYAICYSAVCIFDHDEKSEFVMPETLEARIAALESAKLALVDDKPADCLSALRQLWAI
jgi:hypothetical protein